MAVARYIFPDAGAIESAALAAESWQPAEDAPPDGPLSAPSMVRAAREIRRAATRPGRGAELTAEEAIRLGEMAGLCVPRIRDMIREKADEARAALVYDADDLARRRSVTAAIRARHGIA